MMFMQWGEWWALTQYAEALRMCTHRHTHTPINISNTHNWSHKHAHIHNRCWDNSHICWPYRFALQGYWQTGISHVCRYKPPFFTLTFTSSFLNHVHAFRISCSSIYWLSETGNTMIGCSVNAFEYLMIAVLLLISFNTDQKLLVREKKRPLHTNMSVLLISINWCTTAVFTLLILNCESSFILVWE